MFADRVKRPSTAPSAVAAPAPAAPILPTPARAEGVHPPGPRIGRDFSSVAVFGRAGDNGAPAAPAGCRLVIGRTDDPAESEAQRIVEAGPSRATSAGSRWPHAGPAPGSVHRVLANPGRPLEPATRRIMEAGLRSDFGTVRIFDDDSAARSASEIGSLAYTEGERIAFAHGQYRPATPGGLQLLAHELAHVVQHRESREGRGTVRRYSRFDAAAQKAGTSLGWVHPTAEALRIADDGVLAVEDKGWGPNTGKKAWATAAALAKGNAGLLAAGSKVKLAATAGTISGKPPNDPKGGAVKLTEVEPKKASGSGPLELARDCGKAAQQVMGGSRGGKDVAVMRNAKREQYTKPRVQEGGNRDPGYADPSTPEHYSEEIFKREFGLPYTRGGALDAYAKLPAAKKDAFDRKYGINAYARPHVGEGVTIATEYDMPGFSASGDTWNYHYAATVMESRNDYVTLENAAGWAPTDWIFYMYGPATKAQTFHEEQGAMGSHGSRWTTMVVRPEKSLFVTTDRQASLLVGKAVVKLANGTKLKIKEKKFDKGVEWLIVDVLSGPDAGKAGMVRSSFVQ
jgi:hypothetical protein